MAFILDTDTFSLAVRGNEAIVRRIAEYEGLVFLNPVTVREVLKGALATVADAESPNPRFRNATIVDAYDLLLGLLSWISRYACLPYTHSAEQLWRSLPQQIRRMAPRDCRIAANAVASGMVVVTANTRDFERIAAEMPELRFVNWRESSM